MSGRIDDRGRAVVAEAVASLAALTLVCRALGIPLRREADLPAGPVRLAEPLTRPGAKA